MAQKALRMILLADEPVLPHRVIEKNTGLPEFISMTLGAHQHGKTKLLQGICARLGVLGLLQTNIKDGKFPRVRLYGDAHAILIIARYVSSRSSLRAVYDFPGDANFYRGLVEYAGRLDAAILVVSVAEGVIAITRDHVRLAAELGIPRMAVFLNTETEMVETDLAKLDNVKEDVVALLKGNGFTEAKYFLVAGFIPTTIEEANDDQISAGINQLLGGLERWPLRSSLDKQSLRFPVIGSFEFTNGRTLVIGYVEQGKIVTGQHLDVVGHGSDAQVVVEGSYDVPGVDELTGLWINNSEGAFIKAGHVLAAPGTLDAKQAFKSYIYVLSTAEGGPLSLFSPIPANESTDPRGVFQLGGTMSYYFRASDVHPIGEMSFTFSQDLSTVKINLDTPIPLHRGQRFRILGEDRQIIGSGIVTDIIE